MKSALALTRDLVRSLDEPAAFCKNPLVSPLCNGIDDGAAYTRARSAVLHAIEVLKPNPRTPTTLTVHALRQYEIITRYDLQGQNPADIMCALGIEKSQFYRERARALERIKRFLRESLAQAATCARPANASEYRIASVLQQSGNFDLAFGVLHRLACATEDKKEKAHCLLRIAELQLDTGNFLSAQEYLVLAEEYVAQSKSPLLKSHAELVRCQLAWAGGHTNDTQRRLRSVIGGLTMHAEGSEHFGRLLLGKAVALRANVTFHVSTLSECENVVDYGCEVSASADESARDLYADFLTVRTSIHAATQETLENARADDDALLQFAKDYGLLRKFAVGIKDLAVINHYWGKDIQAELYAEQALALSCAVSGAKERAVAIFEWARVCADKHDEAGLRRARELIAEIRTRLPRGGYWWGYSFATDSYVALAERRAADALRSADEAFVTFRSVKSDRGIGIARGLQANGLRMIGDTVEAGQRAQEAVTHLERAPNPFWLRYAREALASA